MRNGKNDMTKKIYIETFGCQMNDNDSAHIIRLMAGYDYEEATVFDNADLIVLNTCSIREKAEQKVYSFLGRLRKLKNNNSESKIDSRCPEPHEIIGKLGRLATSGQLAEAYGLNEKRVRVKLNRAAKEDFDLRTEITGSKAREAKFLYDTKRAKPYMEKLKANLEK
jgi:hypothetical protein